MNEFFLGDAEGGLNSSKGVLRINNTLYKQNTLFNLKYITLQIYF